MPVERNLSSLQYALDLADSLSDDEKAELIEIVQKRMIQARREEIAQNAEALAKALRNGTLEFDTLDDLLNELLREND